MPSHNRLQILPEIPRSRKSLRLQVVKAQDNSDVTSARVGGVDGLEMHVASINLGERRQI